MTILSIHNAGVGGSSPPVATTFPRTFSYLRPTAAFVTRPFCLRFPVGDLWVTLDKRRKKTHRGGFLERACSLFAKFRLRHCFQFALLAVDVSRQFFQFSQGELFGNAAHHAGGIGYLAITQFSERTGDEFKAALTGLEATGIRALVIDLRNNPGGLLDAAIARTTAVRFSSFTLSGLFNTRETVALDTFASLAISWMVTRLLFMAIAVGENLRERTDLECGVSVQT